MSSDLRAVNEEPNVEVFNYDEARVGSYELPELLRLSDGTAVADEATWRRRREELLSLFADYEYGRTPQVSVAVRSQVLESSATAFDGLGRREQVRLWLGDGDGTDPAQAHIDVLIYTPAAANGAVPVFLGLNFLGNHATTDDPAVRLPTGWVLPRPEIGVPGTTATEAARGAVARRWPMERILERGYAVVTAYYGDIDPDYDHGFQEGVHPLLGTQRTERPPHAWGSIGAWSWGISRILDHLATVPGIDGDRVAVVGHSRLGKSALWAGVQDERIAMAISNDSGGGGAKLVRRNFGCTIAAVCRDFPYWFAPRYETYAGREQELPVDQHELIALMAPRPVYVASAVEDLWADPRGEFLAALHAGPAYELLGYEGLPSAEFPPLDQSLQGRVGYHCRTGGHDLLAADWHHFMDFADRHLTRRS